MPEYTIFLDGDCGTCQTVGRRLRRIDRTGRLAIRSYTEDTSFEEYGLTADLVSQEMQLVRLKDQQIFAGYAAIVELCRAVALLRLIWPFARLLQLGGIGSAAYRAFARRRRTIGKICKVS